MRLHPLVAFAILCAPCLASAEPSASSPKRLETAQPGSRPGKLSALFSTQVQLFIEQKEAPTASKTAMRLETSPRLSDKLKN